MPETYEAVSDGLSPPRQHGDRYRRWYWSTVLNANIPDHRRLRAGPNPNLKPINVPSSLPILIRQPEPKPAHDTEDGLFRSEEGTRYDYEYYQSKSDLNMPSCVPDCKRYPDEHCLPSYTGFPLFLTISSLVQAILFIYFYTSKYCANVPITQYCSAQHILALTGREGDDIWDYDVWRLWTYQFAHAGIGHLLPNVLCQIIFGTLLEIVHGPLRVGSLYTIGVIFGGCFSLIVKPHLNLVGASAGVYALITAVLANTMLNWSEMALWGRVARLVLAGGYLIADIANIYLTGTLGSVSYVAHLGGALVGALLGLVILKNWEIKKYEVKCQTISFFMFLIVSIITAILLIVGDLTHTTLFN